MVSNNVPRNANYIWYLKVLFENCFTHAPFKQNKAFLLGIKIEQKLLRIQIENDGKFLCKSYSNKLPFRGHIVRFWKM